MKKRVVKKVGLERYFKDKIKVDIQLVDGITEINGEVLIKIFHNRKNIYQKTMYVRSSAISCGVRQLSNLPVDYELYTSLNKYIKRGQLNNFFKGLIKETTDLIKEKSNAGFILVSNNQMMIKNRVNTQLSKIAKVETKFETNPNSGNNIKIWIL